MRPPCVTEVAVEERRQRGAVNVGTCTPFVTCVIGTSSSLAPANIGCQMRRATSPCSALTPLRRRLARIAKGVIPGASSGVAGMDAEQPEERVVVHPEPPGEVAVRGEELVGLVGLVPGGDGRVGREDGALATARRAPSRTTLPASACSVASSSGRERRMPFVQVDHGGLDPERLEHPGAADAEQRVLGEPHGPVRLVEPRARPAEDGVVLRQLGVEQQQRHAADVDPPDLERELRVEDRNRELKRLAVGAGDARHRQALRIDAEPVLLLAAGGVDPLPEVAAPVEEADPDHRQRLVARLLEDVAREHAEPARVERQRLVEAELRAHEDDGAVDARARAGGAGQVGRRPGRRATSMRSSSSGLRSTASCVPGQRSPRKRTGFSPESAHRCGLMSRNTSGPSFAHDQR